MKNPFVCVAIPFKGEIELLKDCLDSLLQKSYVSGFAYSIILWDDGSTVDELNSLHSYTSIKYGGMITIIRHENQGYTKTVYDIIDIFKQKSEFDFLLIPNSDIKFRPFTMFSLVKRAITNANIAAVGAKIIKMGTNEIQHTGTRVEDGKIVDPYCGLKEDDPTTMFTERRMWTNGCCTMYNLDVLRRENLNVDLEFTPAYFEESDLMSTLNLLRYSVIYEPRAVVDHKIGATHHKEHSKYEKVFWKNWEKYKEKWESSFTSKQLQF